jgi:GDPmannose 4,6-dehydratase
MALDINGAHYMLAALHQLQRDCRFYFAGTSEMFGRVQGSPQNEQTRFQPRSPYGISKLAGYHLTANYRETYGMFACSGILFNHESPRRSPEFVTRKVSSGLARICLGLANEIHLGNLDATRDWGHARDYVRAMHLMLQQPQPRDFVIATGQPHSVRDLCELAFASTGRDYRQFVVIDERLKRPAEAAPLIGDALLARDVLGWAPTITFDELVQEMVESDIALLRHSLRETPVMRS